MTTPVIQSEEISKSFDNHSAVNTLSMSVENGEIFVLLGSSGCGKTTTLRLIAGLDNLDDGRIYIDNREVSSSTEFLPPENRKIGMVFQDYALFPHMNVEDNVGYGLGGDAQRSDKVRDTLSITNLTGLEKRMPYQLSGGEQQRVALARALATNPRVLLLDEPFSNLDAQLRANVRTETKEIIKKIGIATVLVTHSQEEALIMADKIGVMKEGKIEQIDTPHNIFHKPISEFVANFMGMCDFIPSRIADGMIHTEVGSAPVSLKDKSIDNVMAMVRPDDLSIEVCDTGNAKVVEKTFQGAFYIYKVLLNSGQLMHVLGSHINNLELDQEVNVTLSPGHSLSYMDSNRLIHS